MSDLIKGLKDAVRHARGDEPLDEKRMFLELKVAAAMCEQLAVSLDLDNAGDCESIFVYAGCTPQTARIEIDMIELARVAITAMRSAELDDQQ